MKWSTRVFAAFIFSAIVLYPSDSWQDSLHYYTVSAKAQCTEQHEFCRIYNQMDLGLRNIDSLITLNHALNYEEIAVLKAKNAMLNLRYDEVEKLLFSVKSRQRNDEWYVVYYNWLEFTENYARWEKTSHSFCQKRWNKPSELHSIYYARFLVSQFQFTEARDLLQTIQPVSLLQEKEYLLTQARLDEAQYDFAGADSIYQLMNSKGLTDPDIIADQANCLIRLGRVSDAITSFEYALELNPYQELAHYMLGNGYTRRNYSELMNDYPGKFLLNSADKDSFLLVKKMLNNNRQDSARQFLLSWTEPGNEYVEPFVYLGSMDWADGNFYSALEYFQKALMLVPQYGRAHNGVAKALEGLRIRQSVYYRDEERQFLKEKMPQVSGIESYVVNWNSLSARHQKRVALSVKPWEQFIPVLVASGSRHYIKPLYELLSESPGLESLKDQRIDYDSRLWDDVRGAGGFTTVTGIEDVERMIFHRYNTIIHEMTHQVHAILTPEEKEHIENIYQNAALLESEGQSPFISRYQKASVWEYLAEGVNALYSPRRDQFDTREIVRERLVSKDTALVHLAQCYLNMKDIAPYYPVAFANAIYDRLECADTLNTLRIIERADSLGYMSKDLSEAKIYSYQVFGEYEMADSLIDSLQASFPDQASVWHFVLESAVLQQRDLSALLDSLNSKKKYWSRQQVLEADLILAEYERLSANYPGIAVAASDALSRDNDNETALWQNAIALWKMKRFAESDQFFRQVLERRNGIVELRGDFAEMLLEWGKPAEAADQLREMQNLDKGDPATCRILAETSLLRADTLTAIQAVNTGLLRAPYDERLHFIRLMIDPETAVADRNWFDSMQSQRPYYIYDPSGYHYIRVNAWPEDFKQQVSQYLDK